MYKHIWNARLPILIGAFAGTFLYTDFMPKDNVSYKLLHSIWKKESIESQERIYDLWVKHLDPDGSIGIAEAELSWEELMWLKDEADKK